MIAPRLNTERLSLRRPAMEDFPVYAAFLAGKRSIFMGGPLPERRAWSWFCNDVAQWTLLGIGGLIIVRRDEDTPIGQVAVCHGPIFPEPELGWFLFDGHEGKGYATEAARAMRNWAFRRRGLTSLVSYIDPENAASIAVAERLGAARDPGAATPFDEPTLVFRHQPEAA